MRGGGRSKGNLMSLMLGRGCGAWLPLNINIYCMTSLAFVSQGECEPHSPETRQWKRRVASLESETEILGRIIRIHEATLEEICELVFQ